MFTNYLNINSKQSTFNRVYTNIMKYTILSIISIFLLGVSCKDKTPIQPTPNNYCVENPGSCETVMEGKRYFAFNMGSWWVYEEETSSARDSVYVTESHNDHEDFKFDVRMHSTYQGYNYHYWPDYVNTSSCSLNNESSNKCMFINRSKGKPGDYIGESRCFFVSFIKGSFETTGSDLTYCPNNRIIVDDVLNTFEIGNFSFDKTVKIHELCSYIEGKQSTNHYYSKDIGLVRKELLDSNQIWNLVNYYIAP